MHPILLYLLKMMLCSGILFAYYRVALYNERFHQWNRFYLLAAMLFSLVLPLIEIPLLANTQPAPVIYVLDVLPWNNATQDATAVATPSMLSFRVLMATAFCIISFILLAKLVISILKMFIHYRKASKSHVYDVRIVFTEEQSAPYSFFRWLFWRNDMDVNSPCGQRILQHELTHIRQNHSLDKLVMEGIIIFFWINPIFWLARKELYIIHEFLADQNAVEKNNGSAFAEMILQSIHINPAPALTNPFFTSQIKRRLFMITSSNINKYSYIKRLLTLGIAAGTVLLVACTTDKKENISQPVEVKAEEVNAKQSVRNVKTLDLPEGTLIYLDGALISKTEMQNLNPDALDYDVMLGKEVAIEKYGDKASNGAYEIYSIPLLSKSLQSGREDLPSFPGGQEGWTKYLQTNLRYPDLAIDNGTMGISKIAFTVTTDGSIKDMVIVENPGDGLGEESRRIIVIGPKWVPGRVNGKAVEKRIMLPITYRLE